MAEMRSFYLAPEAWEPPCILDARESFHLARVLRLRAGAEVRLFDGCGRFGMFRVESVRRDAVQLTLLSEGREEPPATRCTLAAAFSKALRRTWFMEKSVELGAAALWFWQGDYSQAALPEAQKQSWQAALLAGAKQCGCATVPALTLMRGGAEAVASRRGDFDRAFLLYEGDTGGRFLDPADLAPPGNVLLVLGPEGGFSPREAKLLAAAGLTPVSLGARVLRWETAAVLTLGLAFLAGQKR
ncbi:MAG: 16S rRNA (uracil(1498)-N(3))-methyltransferase [Desulfovibrio sp.]|jgi:16S rRNA (uracil1498-N3)-methyltransferase|nr:16S rRNA (uracil(1498)-N(3))-methyltransferase [Desulfovibrio sp.]